MIQSSKYAKPLPKYQSLPLPVWLLLVLLAIWALGAPNPIIGVYAIIVEIVIFFLLWIPGQPPIFFLLLSLQWIQSSMRIWQTNLEGLPLDEFAKSPNAEASNWIALNSLFIFSVICGIIIRRSKFSLSNLKTLLQKVDVRKALFAYIIGLLVFPLLLPLGAGGLSQIFLAIQSFKWVLFIVFILSAVEQSKYLLWVIIAFGLELIAGFGGVFSSFRDVIFITLICLGILWYKPNVKRIFAGLPLVMGIGFLFIMWTGIKGEYREFLTGSTFSQQVKVSRNEAYGFLWELVKEFDQEDFDGALESAISRLQYTEMIQMTMDYVPNILPHENGKLWGDAIQHVIFPRFLFPDKPILDDSAIMRKYTGYDWVIPDGAASISLGYIAESYVDFGRDFYFLPSIFLAFLFGGIFLFFSSTKDHRLLLDIGAVIVILLNFQLIERTGSKILGGTIMPLIVYLVIIRPFVYKPILKYILKKQPKDPEPVLIASKPSHGSAE